MMVDSFNISTKKKLENVESFINNTKDTLVNAFGPNPLSTPVGIKVDLATSPDAGGDNWALYLEICDLINTTQEGPKDAARAIRKKLMMSAGKYNNALDYTLNLLDTCVKNCGHRFHVYVAAREFIQDLVKVLNPKYNPPLVIQEKILNLIEVWAGAFKNFQDLQGVVQVNEELKTRGIEPPSGDISREKILSDAPIFTPPPSSGIRSQPSYKASEGQWKPTPASDEMGPSRVQPSSYPEHGDNAGRGDRVNDRGIDTPYALEEKDVVKLRKELDVVRTNAQVLRDLLTQNAEGLDHEDRLLVEKLFSICRDMQSRIVELLDKVSNEDFIVELLGVNDDLNNVFLKYAKYARGMPTNAEEAQLPPASISNTPPTSQSVGVSKSDSSQPFLPKRMPPPVPEEKPLIDLGDEPLEGSSSMFDRLDPFASPSPPALSSRNPYASADPINTGSGSANLFGQPPPVDIKENDLDNINRWLKNKPYEGSTQNALNTVASSNQSSVSTPYDTTALNDDFERFLLERTNNNQPAPGSSSLDKGAEPNERKIF